MGEDDTVARLSAVEVFHGIVYPFKGEGFDYGLDSVSGGKIEHCSKSGGASHGGAGDGTLPHHESENLEVERFEGGADVVEASLRFEGGDVGVPVELHIDGGKDEIERPGSSLNGFGIA